MLVGVVFGLLFMGIMSMAPLFKKLGYDATMSAPDGLAVVLLVLLVAAYFVSYFIARHIFAKKEW